MKTIKILFICMVAAIFANAQQVQPINIEEIAVTPPKFTALKLLANENPLHQFIAENFIYPSEQFSYHQGVEVVRFVVNPSGEISDIKIINSVSREVDSEMRRVLQLTNHMWAAGKNNGSPVPMDVEVAVAVKYGEPNPSGIAEEFTSKAQEYFSRGATSLLIKHKTKQALRNFQNATRYVPYDKGTLFMLAICNLEMGEKGEASVHLSRIRELGGMKRIDESLLSQNIEPFIKAHPELSALLMDSE